MWDPNSLGQIFLLLFDDFRFFFFFRFSYRVAILDLWIGTNRVIQWRTMLWRKEFTSLENVWHTKWLKWSHNVFMFAPFQPRPLSTRYSMGYCGLGTIHLLPQHNFELFLTYLPLRCKNQHKYSTERQQDWQFSRPTHPFLCWRNIWIIPYGISVLDQRQKNLKPMATATVTEVWGHSYGRRSYL